MFDAFMAKHDSLPLGTLIQRFKSVVKVTPELKALLDLALAQRNFLAHGFFRERAVSFAHSAGRDEMIVELDSYHALLTRTDQAVQVAVGEVLPRIGVNVVRMEEETAAIIRELLATARELPPRAWSVCCISSRFRRSRRPGERRPYPAAC
jgi:hypothetical protein